MVQPRLSDTPRGSLVGAGPPDYASLSAGDPAERVDRAAVVAQQLAEIRARACASLGLAEYPAALIRDREIADRLRPWRDIETIDAL